MRPSDMFPGYPNSPAGSRISLDTHRKLRNTAPNCFPFKTTPYKDLVPTSHVDENQAFAEMPGTEHKLSPR